MTSKKRNKHLKVVFLPIFTNPYQSLLQDAMERLGVRFAKVEPHRIYLFLRSVLVAKPDIFHLHWIHPFYMGKNVCFAATKAILFFFQIIFLKLLNIKIAWTAHNLNAHENKFPKMDRFCTAVVLKFASAIIVHCVTAQTMLRSKFHFDFANKIFVVPHGNFIEHYDNTINTKMARRQLGIPLDVFTFLFFGTLRPYKGIVELVDAFKYIGRDDVLLVIAGQPQNDDFEKQVQDIVAGRKNILFSPGIIHEQDIQVYLNAADVVVFPYRDILTSGAVILAMSFARPCIAPAMGCVGEVLDNNGSFLYDPNDTNGLLNGLQRALNNKDCLAEMGYHNRIKAECWDWDVVASRTIEVYMES